MKAEELREMAEQKKVEDANRFWQESGQKLLDELKKAAERGRTNLDIVCTRQYAPSNAEVSWVCSANLRCKVRDELVALGYRVSSEDFEHNMCPARITIYW